MPQGEEERGHLGEGKGRGRGWKRSYYLSLICKILIISISLFNARLLLGRRFLNFFIITWFYGFLKKSRSCQGTFRMTPLLPEQVIKLTKHSHGCATIRDHAFLPPSASSRPTFFVWVVAAASFFSVSVGGVVFRVRTAPSSVSARPLRVKLRLPLATAGVCIAPTQGRDLGRDTGLQGSRPEFAGTAKFENVKLKIFLHF